MKGFASGVLLVVLSVVWPGMAWAENPATIEFGCAPWDGQALRIKMGTSDTVYNVTLWPNGIKALESIAHAATVDNKLDKDGMGTGTVCVTGVDGQSKCTQEPLRVEVKTADFKPGNTIAGTIINKDIPVSFIGTVATHRERCG